MKCFQVPLRKPQCECYTGLGQPVPSTSTLSSCSATMLTALCVLLRLTLHGRTEWNPLIGTCCKHANWACWLQDTRVLGLAGYFARTQESEAGSSSIVWPTSSLRRHWDQQDVAASLCPFRGRATVRTQRFTLLNLLRISVVYCTSPLGFSGLSLGQAQFGQVPSI